MGFLVKNTTKMLGCNLWVWGSPWFQCLIKTHPILKYVFSHKSDSNISILKGVTGNGNIVLRIWSRTEELEKILQIDHDQGFQFL